ncbi:Hypothetical protein I595_2821 [Croceitalea dokdonensis DOKDO 023]|uniref:Uncharacterized protein n=1 Tax=Croceitalea dokdonensis DOKDO 023 TaxID=1300341 RepID=A0A0N8H3K7_9FLAO|nr:Hypothetical protein I595_2821 [Croceitalea dokdonensis DOKDO 023]
MDWVLKRTKINFIIFASCCIFPVYDIRHSFFQQELSNR